MNLPSKIIKMRLKQEGGRAWLLCIPCYLASQSPACSDQTLGMSALKLSEGHPAQNSLKMYINYTATDT